MNKNYCLQYETLKTTSSKLPSNLNPFLYKPNIFIDESSSYQISKLQKLQMLGCIEHFC